MRYLLIGLFALALTWFPTTGRAWYPRLPAEALLQPHATPVIGSDADYIIGEEETLMEVARRAGLGFDNLLRANPGLDPWNPGAGQKILLPRAALLPRDAGPGITINIAEQRLYLIWEENEERWIRIYPVGIGREGWETPLGRFEVLQIVKNPAWVPPASLREEKPDLPSFVPPGPDNPLGDYWIGLSAKGVGIHGTNQPYGVGRRISYGCLRLYPEDIRDLVEHVGPGTPVRIVNQPIKLALWNDTLFLEAHPSEQSAEMPADPGLALAGRLPPGPWPGLELQRILREQRGTPQQVLPR